MSGVLTFVHADGRCKNQARNVKKKKEKKRHLGFIAAEYFILQTGALFLHLEIRTRRSEDLPLFSIPSHSGIPTRRPHEAGLKPK